MVAAKKKVVVPTCTTSTYFVNGLTITPDGLYSTADLAYFLKIHRRTLEAWRRTASMPSLRWVRVGRRVRYRGNDILHFLEDSASPPKAKRRRR